MTVDHTIMTVWDAYSSHEGYTILYTVPKNRFLYLQFLIFRELWNSYVLVFGNLVFLRMHRLDCHFCIPYSFTCEKATESSKLLEETDNLIVTNRGSVSQQSVKESVVTQYVHKNASPLKVRGGKLIYPHILSVDS